MKGNGNQEKKMEREFLNYQTVNIMTELLSNQLNKDMEYNFSQMEIFIRVNISKVDFMAEESTIGLMGHLMMEILLMAVDKDQGDGNQLKKEAIYTPGNISKTRNKVEVNIFGAMAVDMMDIFRMT